MFGVAKEFNNYRINMRNEQVRTNYKNKSQNALENIDVMCQNSIATKFIGKLSK